MSSPTNGDQPAAPSGPAAPTAPVPPTDVMEALGLRVQLSFPELLALPPEQPQD